MADTTGASKNELIAVDRVAGSAATSSPPGKAGSLSTLAAIWKHTDKITKWIQVAALVFAAGWTFWTFRETQASSLETPATVAARLDWRMSSAPPKGYCSITATFEVTDQGTKSFDVAYATVRAWRTNMPAQAEGYQYINISDLERKIAPLSNLRIEHSEDSPIVGHYAPRTSIHAGFPWVFYGPASNDLFFARIDAYDKSGVLLGEASAWTEGMCN
jgi:hypothetical protein